MTDSMTAAAAAPARAGFYSGQDSYTLSIPAATFAAAVRAVATAAELNSGVDAFSSISFSLYTDGGFELAATDRFRLAVASGTDATSHRVSAAILPAKGLLKFAKGIKVPARGTVPPVTVVLDTDQVSFVWNGSSVSWLRSDLPDIDRYPTYRKLLAPVQAGEGSVSSWNPVFVESAAEACRIMGADKATPMLWDCPNPLKPATFRPADVIGGLQFTYLVMPMRLS